MAHAILVPAPTMQQADEMTQQNVGTTQASLEPFPNNNNPLTQTTNPSGNSVDNTNNDTNNNTSNNDNSNIIRIELSSIDIDHWKQRKQDEKKDARYGSDDDNDKDNDNSFSDTLLRDCNFNSREANVFSSFEEIYNNVAIKFGNILTTLSNHDTNGFLFGSKMDQPDIQAADEKNENEHDVNDSEAETKLEKEKTVEMKGDIIGNDKMEEKLRRIKEKLLTHDNGNRLSPNLTKKKMFDKGLGKRDIDWDLSLCEASLCRVQRSGRAAAVSIGSSSAGIGGMDQHGIATPGVMSSSSIVSGSVNHLAFNFSSDESEMENKTSTEKSFSPRMAYSNRMNSIHGPRSRHIDRVETDLGFVDNENRLQVERRIRMLDTVKKLEEYFDLEKNKDRKEKNGEKKHENSDDNRTSDDSSNIVNLPIEQWNWKQVVNWLQNEMTTQIKYDSYSLQDMDKRFNMNIRTYSGKINTNKNYENNKHESKTQKTKYKNSKDNKKRSKNKKDKNKKNKNGNKNKHKNRHKNKKYREKNGKNNLNDTPSMKQFFQDFACVCYEYQIDGCELICLNTKQISLLVESKKKKKKKGKTNDNIKDNNNSNKTDETRIAQMASGILLNEIRRLRTSSLFIRFYKLLWKRLDLMCDNNNHQDDDELIDDIKWIIKNLRYNQLKQNGPYLNDKNWNSNAPFLTKIDCFISYLIMPPIVQHLIDKICPNYAIGLPIFAQCHNNTNDGKTKRNKHNKRRMQAKNEDNHENDEKNLNKTRIMDDLASETLRCRQWMCKQDLCNCITLFGVLLAKFLITAVITTTFTICWYSIYIFPIVDETFDRTLDSISERIITDIEYEFSKAQTILQTLVIGIDSGDLPTNPLDVDINNGSYDEYFRVFAYANLPNIYDCFVSVHDKENNTRMTGMRRNSSFTDNLVAFEYNGEDLVGYDYDKNNQTRLGDGTTYKYTPQDRPWHILAMSTDVNEMVWTDMYPFAGGDDVLGMTLTQRITKGNLTYIFCVEFTVSILQTLLKEYNLPLEDGFVYIVDENDTLIATGQNETIWNEMTDTPGILDVKQEITTKTNAFYMVLPRAESNFTRFVSGSVVIGYTDKYKQRIIDAQTESIIISCVMAFVIVILSMALSIKSSFDVRLHATINKQLTKCENLWECVKMVFKGSKHMSTMECCSYFLLGWIFGCLCSVYSIWFVAADESYLVLKNTISTEEHLHILQKIDQMFSNAELIRDIIAARFNRGDMRKMEINTTNGTVLGYDNWFWNLMKSFPSKDDKHPYLHSLIYMGLPTGEIYGSGTREVNGSWILTNSVRDINTSWVYNVYGTNDDGSRNTEIDPYRENNVYDVRCRDWFGPAIEHTFNGTFGQAFPDETNYQKFVEYEGEPTTREECQNAIKSFKDMFGIEKSENGSTRYYGTKANNPDKKSLMKLVWSRYVFASDDDVGLTASMAIKDPITGDLLAVVGIDYTLKYLSQFLVDSIESTTDESSSDQSIAFVFAIDSISKSTTDLNISDLNITYLNDTLTLGGDTYTIEYYPMIASSTGSEDVVTSPDQIPGSTCSEIAHVEWEANYHNKTLTRIFSTVIDERIGINSAQMKTNVNDSDYLSPITIALDLPTMVTSRVQYNTETDAGIDWIIVSAMDSLDQDTQIRHVQLTTLVIWVAIGLIVFYLVSISNTTLNDNSYNSHNLVGMIELTETTAKTIGKVVRDAFVPVFWYEVTPNKEKAQILHNERTYANEASHKVITMNLVKHIALEGAALQLSYLQDHKLAYNRDQLMIHAVLGAKQAWIYQWVLSVFSSAIYDTTIQIVVLCHVVTAFGEYDTPNQLADRCKNNVSYESTSPAFSDLIFGVKLVCIIIECIDLIIQFVVAEMRLKARNDANDSISALIISHRRRLVALFVASTLIVVNFILVNVCCMGIFCYYIPIVPILLIIRNDYIYNAMKYFIIALNYGKYVLITFVWFILISTILGMALFGEILNPTTIINSFKTIFHSFVTMFIFNTGSNMNDIMYPLYQENVTSVVFLFIIIVLGLFVATPVLIHSFEQSYHQQIKHKKKLRMNQKLNAIVSAFVVMDLDNDGKINRNECETLFNYYNIQNKSSNRSSGMDTDSIDIHDFVSIIMDHDFGNKRSQKSITLGWLDNAKYESFWECNWFGNSVKSQAVTLLFGLFPAGVAGTLYNFEQVPTSVLNSMVLFSYILQLIELILKMYVYGFNFRRYLYFDSYPNPPFIQSAIDLIKYPNKILVNWSKNDILWIKRNLASGVENVKYLNQLQNMDHRKQTTMTNRFDFCIILISVIGLLSNMNYYVSSDSYNLDSEIKHVRFWLLFPLWRLLTVIVSNKRLVFVIGRVIAAGNVLSLLSFLILFIFIWARIGTALFNGASKYVISDVYDTSTDANFNNLPNGILSLLQITVGEGWHEIMYLNVISTRYVYILYFVVFVIIVTLLLNNIFVGLFLAGIDELNDKNVNHKCIEYPCDSKQDKAERIKKLKMELYYLENSN